MKMPFHRACPTCSVLCIGLIIATTPVTAIATKSEHRASADTLSLQRNNHPYRPNFHSPALTPPQRADASRCARVTPCDTNALCPSPIAELEAFGDDVLPAPTQLLNSLAHGRGA